MNLSSWVVRVGVIAGLTYAAYKYLPLGNVGKTVALAIGGVSAAGVVTANVPLAAQLISGNVVATQ